MYWYARLEHVKVASSEDMRLAVARYNTEGFVVTQRTPTVVTLERPMEFRLGLALLLFFIGFVAVELPLIVYVTYILLSRALGWDQVVYVELAEQRWRGPPASVASRGLGQVLADEV